MLQLIGYYLLEYVRDKEEITSDHIELANAGAKRDMTDNIYRPVLKTLSNKDLQFLKAMSEDKGASRISDIKTRLKENDGTVQAYRKRLLEAGVVASERRGELEFTLPYFNEYLMQNE